MSEAYDFGMRGEQRALGFLKESGYTLVHRNYRFERAELDLVVKKENVLVVVEVKARKTNSTVGDWQPEKSVNARKKRLLVRAANALVEEVNWKEEVRFDIVALNYIKGEWHIRHHPNAFKAYEL